MKFNIRNSKHSNLGEFEITTGNVIISDPCYDLDTWCTGKLSNVKKGIWEANIITCDEDNWGRRVSCLYAYCYDEIIPIFFKNELKITDRVNESKKLFKIDANIGVDSGQCGIFDLANYKQDYKKPYLQVGTNEYSTKSAEYSRSESLKEYERLLALDDKDGTLKTIVDNLKGSLPKFEVHSTTDWYEVCCDKTLSNQKAGTVIGGCVASSGFGDGSYQAYQAKTNKETVFIGVVFIN